MNTGAVASAGFRSTVKAISAGTTGSVAVVGFSGATGTFSTGDSGVDSSGFSKYWLPDPLSPIGIYRDGKVYVEQTWYKFFKAIADKLGGPAAPNVTTIIQNISATKEVSAQASIDANSAYDLARSGAITANDTRQVAIDNNLAGATSIPKVGIAP